MSTTRRFVYLLLEEFGRRRSNYTLRNIDMDRFFLPRPTPVVPSVASAVAADAVEYASLPCPAMTFYPPFSTLFGNQKMEFLLLGGNHNNAVVAVDQTCRTVLYDPGEHAVRTMPALPYQVRLLTTSVTVGDDLYILDTSRRHVNDDGGGNVPCGCFYGLIYEDGLNEDWRCHALPPPPPPLSHKSDLHVHSYAVVGDMEIWMSSTHGSGIYCFDTVSHVWSTVATGWKLPFVGLAEYCHEHGLWFGLSCSTGDRRRSLVLSALDLDGTKLPVLHSLPLEFTPPDALQLVSSYLVNLGAAKFCIARFFQTDEDQRDGEELFAVLTAVEVERCDDDDDAGGANGGGLRMLKHRQRAAVELSRRSVAVEQGTRCGDGAQAHPQPSLPCRPPASTSSKVYLFCRLQELHNSIFSMFELAGGTRAAWG
ncbi:Os08g0165200 [Oryza sativa Japonica Group]|uniref:Os08g0165200 protein n=1 Tax=Oryza sativa subsp. japonica TaxID=39947 RepID=Q0J7S8_ORYSJ|nr:Os08g0165200 [Oryza sativa Japonica Group]|eukprot:NP_001061073.2 Os08g0165200 [Oryza sativa Japonica Group]